MPEPNDRSMQDLKPTVWIGKQGCTPAMIEEIVTQLKKRRLIKVKWLQNTEVDPEAVAVQAKARLVEVRGRTMVLAEKARAPESPGKAAAKVTAKTMGRAAAKARAPERAPDKVQEKPVEKFSAKSHAKKPAKEAEPSKPRQTGMMKAAKK